MSPIRLLIMLLLLSCAAVSAQETPPNRILFYESAQDGQGTVWGIYNRLLFFDGKDWKTAPSPFAPEDMAQAKRLVRLQDGSIGCVWQLSRERIAVTRNTPAESKLLGTCQGRFENYGLRPPPFADSHGQLWLTNAEGDVYRLDKDGKLALALSIKPDQLIHEGEESGKQANNFVVEDGRGRIWIWSNSLEYELGAAQLRGVLIGDGGKFTQQEHFEGITNPRYTFIERKDDKHMWVAVLQEGIFSVDIDTMKAEPLAAPEPWAFLRVQKIFSAGGDLFVIAIRDGGPFNNALWRLRDGKWTRLLDNVDNSPSPSMGNFSRPWLRIGGDTLICSYGSGPWIVHDDGTTERLDWRHGFNIGSARYLFALPDGGLAASGGYGQIFMGKVSLAAPAKPSRATEVVFLHHGWTADAEGNIWTMLSEKSGTLSEWDGARWHDHPLPAEKQTWGFFGIRVDTRGRVWLLPATVSDSWTACFDPHSGKWSQFQDMQAALTELKNDPPQFSGEHWQFCLPDYSADLKRAAYRNNSVELVYFDGKQWRRWKRQEIDPNAGRDDVAIGQPFFDKTDHLCICLGGDAWQWDDAGHWQQAAVEVKYPDDSPGSAWRHAQRVLPPDGCVTTTPESIVADNNGVAWLTWQGALYKCAFGKCVKVFADDEPNPFADGRKITDVWINPRGAAMVQTEFDKVIMIAPKSPPPPKPSIAVEKTAPDSVTVRLQGEAALFRWKLDGGPWQVAAGPSFPLANVANGPHTLTAVAIDADLQAGPAAEEKLDIQIDPTAQIAALIKNLGDADSKVRESAVAALARQPAAALPALKAARENAGSDQRWWIDATIQEIDRGAANGAK